MMCIMSISILFSLIALSVHAKENNYACPKLTEENLLAIKAGRFVNRHQYAFIFINKVVEDV